MKTTTCVASWAEIPPQTCTLAGCLGRFPILSKKMSDLMGISLSVSVLFFVFFLTSFVCVLTFVNERYFDLVKFKFALTLLFILSSSLRILRLTLAAKFLLDVKAVRIAINSSELRNCLGGRLGWSLELSGVKGRVEDSPEPGWDAG